MKRLFDYLTHTLASLTFFRVTLGFFVFEALWIAFSSVYPMAFDEDFHFGLIQIYAHHWSPFLASQPAGGDSFGAVARDPSYLYHYLMSFPYRFLAMFIHGQSAQIVVLRVMNVAMFASSLVLFRRVLLRVTSSSAMTNVSLAIFVLIPIVPQLAAHINYDNLLMILVAWSCLLVFRLADEFAKKQLNMTTLATLASVGMLTSLVKYAYLPIFAAIVLFVVYAGARSFASFGEFWQHWRAGWTKVSPRMRIGLVTVVLLSFGLFFQRYGVNSLKYHTPVPVCDQVLSEQHCSAYGPWQRNYLDAQQTSVDFDTNPLVYTARWFYGLWYRLFFAVNGPSSDYTNYRPEPLPGVTAVVLAIVGIGLAIAYSRRIFVRHPLMIFFLLVIVLYCGALWHDDYAQFVATNQPVAVNGRYLLPILLPIAAIVGRAMSLALRRSSSWVKPAMATLVLLLFLQGGGVFNFILRSDPSWDWSSAPVVKVNNAARKILQPFVIQNSKQY